MKTLVLVLALMMVAGGVSVADTVSFDLYGQWNLVSCPLVPFVPAPWNGLSGVEKGVFDPVDIDFMGSMSRWDAASQGQIGWSQFNPGDFGNILLGEGYWVYQGDPQGPSPVQTVSYSGVPDGVPDANGVKTDMWISLSGQQGDGDLGGWHLIGHPFNHEVCISKEPGNLLGDNITITDGTTLKTWGEAVAEGWVNDPMTTWDGVSQGENSVGYFFAADEYLRPGHGYWVRTNKDNLAMIIPAD